MMEAAGKLIALASEETVNGQRWVHLLPVGTFDGVDGRGPFHVHDLDSIVNASREASGRRKMVIDYNHSTDLAGPKGQETPAAGWIIGLQSRQDGIWGLVEWTEKASRHIADREYRYISPVISHDRQGRVSQILRASLVNVPNFDQLTALASAENTMQDQRIADKLKQIVKELNTRPATAAEIKELGRIADTIAELEEKANTASSHASDPSQFVPIGQFERAVQEVRRLNQGISLQAAQTHVSDQIERGNILPWMKDWAISLCTSNKPALDAFIEKTKPALQRLLTPTHTAEPFGSRVAIHAAEEPLTPEEQEVCRRLSITADEYRSIKGMPNNRPE